MTVTVALAALEAEMGQAEDQDTCLQAAEPRRLHQADPHRLRQADLHRLRQEDPHRQRRFTHHRLQARKHLPSQRGHLGTDRQRTR